MIKFLSSKREKRDKKQENRKETNRYYFKVVDNFGF